jgi:hypothetical protein
VKKYRNMSLANHSKNSVRAGGNCFHFQFKAIIFYKHDLHNTFEYQLLKCP